MYRACSKCGKIHDSSYKCKKGTIYKHSNERALRNSYPWQQKSLRIRKRSNYLCAVCKQEGVFTYNNLEVHHIVKLKDAPERLLDDYNLICLCQEHHKKADSGEIDKDYLFELAKLREEAG